jgi:hypothetical protein
MPCELQHKLDDLNGKQQVLDKQLHSTDEKDQHIAIQEKKAFRGCRV